MNEKELIEIAKKGYHIVKCKECKRIFDACRDTFYKGDYCHECMIILGVNLK